MAAATRCGIRVSSERGGVVVRTYMNGGRRRRWRRDAVARCLCVGGWRRRTSGGGATVAVVFRAVCGRNGATMPTFAVVT